MKIKFWNFSKLFAPSEPPKAYLYRWTIAMACGGATKSGLTAAYSEREIRKGLSGSLTWDVLSVVRVRELTPEELENDRVFQL